LLPKIDLLPEEDDDEENDGEFFISLKWYGWHFVIQNYLHLVWR
jgi:hypothetical protein